MEEPKVIQGVFDFESGHLNGIENWRVAREAYEEQIRKELHVPLGRRVRIRIRGRGEPLLGKLELAKPPKVLSREVPLDLKVGAVRFSQRNIQSWSLEGEPECSSRTGG